MVHDTWYTRFEGTCMHGQYQCFMCRVKATIVSYGNAHVGGTHAVTAVCLQLFVFMPDVCPLLAGSSIRELSNQHHRATAPANAYAGTDESWQPCYHIHQQGVLLSVCQSRAVFMCMSMPCGSCGTCGSLSTLLTTHGCPIPVHATIMSILSWPKEPSTGRLSQKPCHHIAPRTVSCMSQSKRYHRSQRPHHTTVQDDTERHEFWRRLHAVWPASRLCLPGQ